MPLKTICRLIPFLFLASCVNLKKAIYFDDVPNSRIKSTVANLEPVFEPNDVLSISITSLNPNASAIFNNQPSPASLSTVSGTISNASGYLIDQDGYIQLPVIGNIKAAGLNKKQLKDYIVKTILDKQLLVDPVVTIRYLNFKVTVLGEVAHPTIVNVPNEKVTLLEALGLAGDITIYGKRDNVLILREEGEEKIIHRVNLNSAELLTSPYYYLKSNDVVYVEPNSARVAGSGRTTQILPIILSGLSFTAIILDRVTRSR
jgi:polysaccharide export outer membrane protein